MDISIKELDRKMDSLKNRIKELSALLATQREMRTSNDRIRIEMHKCLKTIAEQKQELDTFKLVLEKRAEQIDRHVSNLLQMIKVDFTPSNIFLFIVSLLLLFPGI